MPRTIILTLAPSSRDSSLDSELWSVTEDGRICDSLCWDEMLGVVARITLHEYDSKRGPMLTVQDHKDAAEAKALRNATPSRIEDALRQVVHAFHGNETAGPLPAAIEEAAAAIAAVEAKRQDEEVPF
ncbi:hypothetical protein VLK31_07005 [Variovorax sp. H27-G14]|uniref:hypothetical protein n=1 Tax=Variovorax sp. H27-G14 TaxID=3111914 RepID=UPI0038FD0D57